MGPAEEFARLAGEMLVILLHIASAFAHLREADVESALRELSEVVAKTPQGRYADEALYWRARIAEADGDREARAAAARDYLELLKRLPDGRLRREVRVRLAALAEPGRLLSAEEASEASRRRLERIGRALHDFAADHGGSLPGALEDLLDDYLTDPSLLVRPGPIGAGGSRPYAYAPGFRTDLRPAESPRAPAATGGLPVIVLEPEAAADGTRLALRLDGEVVTVRQAPRAEPRSGAPQAEGETR